jgi:antitoxin HigA-1
MSTKAKRLPPIHPGRALKEVLDDAGITAALALRLARYLGTSARMWMNLQSKYDLEMAEDALGNKIEAEVQSVIN